mmetsp:Transcript_16619/g.28766  ORF Transcript_16619/g.28766 Transcript_16619/m.28766 type:complete len:368 (+) Transcript_16619:363-1466(+)
MAKVLYLIVALLAAVSSSSNGASFDDVPIARADRERYIEYISMAAWIYNNKVNRSSVVPYNYTVKCDGDRWALLETPKSKELVLVHRGTFAGDPAEWRADFDSQTSAAQMINGINVNPAFWGSYATFRDEQNKCIKQTLKEGNYPHGLHITGHSLGGATSQMALVDISTFAAVQELVPSATPRALAYTFAGAFNSTEINCDNFKKLVTGPNARIVRVNRGTTGLTEQESYEQYGKVDIVGAVPMRLQNSTMAQSWIQCAHVHAKIASENMTGGFTGMEAVDAKFPWPYLQNDFAEFMAWSQGPLAEWHNTAYYVAGIQASLPHAPAHVTKNVTDAPTSPTSPPTSSGISSFKISLTVLATLFLILIN